MILTILFLLSITIFFSCASTKHISDDIVQLNIIAKNNELIKKIDTLFYLQPFIEMSKIKSQQNDSFVLNNTSDTYQVTKDSILATYQKYFYKYAHRKVKTIILTDTIDKNLSYLKLNNINLSSLSNNRYPYYLAFFKINFKERDEELMINEYFTSLINISVRNSRMITSKNYGYFNQTDIEFFIIEAATKKLVYHSKSVINNFNIPISIYSINDFTVLQLFLKNEIKTIFNNKTYSVLDDNQQPTQ